ncbi:hypothetical protein [uncultured Endozoicomonas sp.]|uniref:hypothetical protein n=1 Tax=uncultured Endozoicomonas sp. TaxID=432652 RepID=UPI0026043E9E|nr:hypothetical protein [uncultured Endozoicomonas sp.]
MISDNNSFLPNIFGLMERSAKNTQPPVISGKRHASHLVMVADVDQKMPKCDVVNQASLENGCESAIKYKVRKVSAELKGDESNENSGCNSAVAKLNSKPVSKVERKLRVPKYIDVFFGVLLNQINNDREKRFFPQDIALFYKMIVESERGGVILAILKAFTFSYEKCCENLTLIDGEYSLSAEEYDDSIKYLKNSIFNGKKVAFCFYQLGMFLNLVHKDCDVFTDLPDKLQSLIRGLIDKVLEERLNCDASLNTREFFEIKGYSKSGMELLYCLYDAKNLFKVASLRSIVEKYKNNNSEVYVSGENSLENMDVVIDENMDVVIDENMDVVIDENMVLKLKGFFDGYFFNGWFVGFTGDDLFKRMVAEGKKEERERKRRGSLNLGC